MVTQLNNKNLYCRLAGAQIPVRKTVTENLITLKAAIDWAAENKVDFLVTPEASLSGYVKDFDTSQDLVGALTEIEKYTAYKGVGLCLGTLWTEDEGTKKVKRNQIRYYDKQGQLAGITNKTLLAPEDYEIGIEPNTRPNGIYLPLMHDDGTETEITSAGFICKDLYGRANYPNLPSMAREAKVMLGIHSTNAMRNVGECYDPVMYDWHKANLQIVSYLAGGPIITVDNSIMLNGDEYDGPTSSPSGILIGGKWVVQAPSTGTQYFYYDLPLENLLNRDWPNGPGKN